MICAVRPRSSAPVIVDASIETKRVSAVSPRHLAFADGGVEAFVDLAREQAAQLAAVALGKGGHDHLVGGARAGDEVLGVEGRIAGDDGVEPGGDARPALGDALPAIRRRRRRLGLPRCRFRRTRRQGHDFVVCRAAHGVARRIRIIGRPLAAGALSQHAAKPQENEHRERQEDDGVDVEHVSLSFGGAKCGSAHPSGGSQRRNPRESPVPALCRHARGAIQRVAVRRPCRRESKRSEPPRQRWKSKMA